MYMYIIYLHVHINYNYTTNTVHSFSQYRTFPRSVSQLILELFLRGRNRFSHITPSLSRGLDRHVVARLKSSSQCQSPQRSQIPYRGNFATAVTFFWVCAVAVLRDYMPQPFDLPFQKLAFSRLQLQASPL